MPTRISESAEPDARREALALARAQGMTWRKAAVKAGVAESTCYLWAAEPWFAKRVTELRGEMFDRAVCILARGNAAAAQRLVKLSKSKDEKVARLASRDVLEMGTKLRDSTELAERLAVLEELESKRQETKAKRGQ
jgi:hypothetical protein